MDNTLKQQCYLLGADAITKNKEGKELDFSIVRFAFRDDKGNGWAEKQFFYGRAIDAKGINAMVHNGVILVNCEFSLENDYKGGFRVSLRNFAPVK